MFRNVFIGGGSPSASLKWVLQRKCQKVVTSSSFAFVSEGEADERFLFHVMRLR
jgi:hypothetical protein